MQQVMYHSYDCLYMDDLKERCESSKVFLEDVRIASKLTHLNLLSKKTQLIPCSSQYYNRLDHTLDVKSVSVTIVNRINHCFMQNKISSVSTEIVKAISLLHDIGHPPFGHSGERVLDRIMKDKGGFESNAQNFKIVSNNAMRLSKRTIVSLLKHRTKIPITRLNYQGLIKGYYGYMSEFIEPLLLTYHETVIESAIVDLADTLSYVLSDIRDLIIIYGESKLTNMIEINIRSNSFIKDAMLKFDKFNFQELSDLIYLCIDEIKRDIVIPISENVSKAVTKLPKNIIEFFIKTIDVEINQFHPMYSKITLSSENQLKIYILKQITKRCYLNSKLNKEIDKEINVYMRSVFDYLYHLDTEDSKINLEKKHLEKLINITDKVEKARYVCDLICMLSDLDVMEFVGNKRSDILIAK